MNLLTEQLDSLFVPSALRTIRRDLGKRLSKTRGVVHCYVGGMAVGEWFGLSSLADLRAEARVRVLRMSVCLMVRRILRFACIRAVSGQC